MRRIKKHIRNLKFFYNNRTKVKSSLRMIKDEFPDVIFKFSSVGGADMNYFLLKNNTKFAMARLAILDFKVTKDEPLQRFEKSKRLEKEYHAYTQGSTQGLTPKVLFSFDDGLVCEYLEGKRVFDVLKKDKSQVWSILTQATQTYSRLHALGITHLDATLKNFILDGSKMKVIDFEYYPSENFSIEEQKAYDYVRIIEHTLRTIPENYQEGYRQFIVDLDKIIPMDIRQIEFTYVKPWIQNIQTYPIYTELKEKIFTKLTFN